MFFTNAWPGHFCVQNAYSASPNDRRKAGIIRRMPKFICKTDRKLRKSKLIIPILLTTQGAAAEGGRPLSSPLHWYD